MAESKPLDIHLGSLLAWVLMPVLAVAVFGILPTWLTTGWTGVAAQGAGVGVVLAIMIGTGGLTLYAARQGAGPASTVFLGTSLMRLLLSPALGWLLVWLFGLLLEPLMLWVIITYLLCLGLEVIWIVRALRRSTTGSKRRSAGETDTDKQHSTRNYEI